MRNTKRISFIYSAIIAFVYYLLSLYFYDYDESRILMLEAVGIMVLLGLEVILPVLLRVIYRRTKEAYVDAEADYTSFKLLFIGIGIESIVLMLLWCGVHVIYELLPYIVLTVLEFGIIHLLARIVKVLILLPYFLTLKKGRKNKQETIQIYLDLFRGILPDTRKKLVLFINKRKYDTEKDRKKIYFLNTKDTYLLTESEVQKYINNNFALKNALYEQIMCFCYLIEPFDSKEFHNQLEQIYQDVFVNRAGSYTKQVIIFNYSLRGEMPVPDKYKNISSIKICTIKSPKEITEAKIRILLEKEQKEAPTELQQDWQPELAPKVKSETQTGEKIKTGEMTQTGEMTRTGEKTKTDSTPENKKKDDIELYKSYFENCDYFLEKINCFGEYSVKYHFANNELRNFFNSALTFQNPTQSIMALVDYIEIILRLSSLYYGIKDFNDRLSYVDQNQASGSKKVIYNQFLEQFYQRKKRRDILPADLFSLGYDIWRDVYTEDPLYSNIHQKTYQYSPVLQSIFQAVDIARFEGERINFLGLCRTMNHVRNKVIAHGSLQNSIIYPVWCMLFYGAVTLTEFLRIEDMKLEYIENSYWLSYQFGSRKINMQNFIVNQKDYPCLAWNMVLKETESGFRYTLKYINFFEGELVKPEHFEENFAM